MNLKVDHNQIYPPNIQIFYLINEFVKQRIDDQITNISLANILDNENLVIDSLSQLISLDLQEYLQQVIIQEPYRLLIKDISYLSEYTNTMTRYLSSAIKSAVEKKVQTLYQ